MKTATAEYMNANNDETKNVAYAINNDQMSVTDVGEDFSPYWINPKTTKLNGGIEAVESMLLPKKLEQWQEWSGNKKVPTVAEVKGEKTETKADAKAEAKK